MNESTLNEKCTNNEIGTFTCPSYKIVQQLVNEIRMLRNELNNHPLRQEALIDNVDLKNEFKISRSTASVWRNSGLAFVKRGAKIYYKRKDITDFLSKYKHRGF